MFTTKNISDCLEYSREGDARCSAAAVGPRGGDLLSSWGHRPTVTAASASLPTPPQWAGGRDQMSWLPHKYKCRCRCRCSPWNESQVEDTESISVTVKSCFEIREGQNWFYWKNTPLSNTLHGNDIWSSDETLIPSQNQLVIYAKLAFKAICMHKMERLFFKVIDTLNLLRPSM